MTTNEIKNLIKDSKLTQWQVAELMGISEFTLVRWFRKTLSMEQENSVTKAIKTLCIGRFIYEHFSDVTGKAMFDGSSTPEMKGLNCIDEMSDDELQEMITALNCHGFNELPENIAIRCKHKTASNGCTCERCGSVLEIFAGRR